MITVSEAWMAAAEARYPGVTADIASYEERAVPPCPACGAPEVTIVIGGLVGRTIAIAAATSKVTLLPNAPGGQYSCRRCLQRF